MDLMTCQDLIYSGVPSLGNTSLSGYKIGSIMAMMVVCREKGDKPQVVAQKFLSLLLDHAVYVV